MRINEIFYSLQGEGFHSGKAAVFVRLSGCNLKCSFCDTNHLPYKEMSEDEIINEISVFGADHVVITGGEPALQITSSFVNKLHEKGMFVQMETNGSIQLPDDCEIDWITCSPKQGAEVKQMRVDEWKVLYHGNNEAIIERYANLPAKCYSLQPLDTQDAGKNAEILACTINYILKHPQWRLSLQTHKMIGVR